MYIEKLEKEKSDLIIENEKYGNENINEETTSNTNVENIDLIDRLKSSLKDIETENDFIKQNNVILIENIKKLETENAQLKDIPLDSEVVRYKEFLKRTQEEYKALEKEVAKEKDKHKVEIDNLSLKRIETEEKYGRVIKEKETFIEKERIFLETFDALTKLNDILKNSPKPVVGSSQ